MSLDNFNIHICASVSMSIGHAINGIFLSKNALALYLKYTALVTSSTKQRVLKMNGESHNKICNIASI